MQKQDIQSDCLFQCIQQIAFRICVSKPYTLRSCKQGIKGRHAESSAGISLSMAAGMNNIDLYNYIS